MTGVLLGHQRRSRRGRDIEVGPEVNGFEVGSLYGFVQEAQGTGSDQRDMQLRERYELRVFSTAGGMPVVCAISGIKSPHRLSRVRMGSDLEPRAVSKSPTKGLNSRITDARTLP